MKPAIRLLIVEDNPGDARLIREQLSEAPPGSFDVRTTPSLQSALDALSASPADVVLLDLTLPDAKGLDGLRRIRAAHGELPIVILTGLHDEQFGLEATRAGAQDYLVKGESPGQTLSRIIRYAIERKQSETALRRSAEQYRQMFEGNPTPMVVFDQETLRILAVNAAMIEHYGWTRQEFLRMTIADYRPPEDVERIRKKLTGVNSSQKLGLWTHITKDGKRIEVDVATTVVEFEGRRAMASLLRDVTDYNRMMRDLEDSERNYRALFDSAADALIVVEVDTGRVREMNAAALKMYGYSRAELAPLNYLSLSAEPEKTASLLKAMQTDSLYSVPHRLHRRKGGSIFPVEIRIASHKSKAGKMFVCAVRDITERVEAQRELADSERRFRLMTENISQVFWMSDPDKTRLLYVSPAYETIWGRSLESLYRDPQIWLDSIHPEDRERIFNLARDWKEGLCDVTYRIVRPDGEIRWIRNQAFPVRDQSGRMTNITGVAEDVTEQTRISQALRESQGLLERAESIALLGSWSAPIGMSGPLIWSKECHSIFRLPPKETPSVRRYFKMIHPDDREKVRRARGDALRGGGQYAVDYRLIRGDGALRWVSVRADVLRDEAGHPTRFVGVVQDVTERVEAEKKLRETEKQLRQAQKMEAVGRLAGGVAHDFNNLLTAILGLTEISIAAASKGTQLRGDLEEIEATAKRAAALTQQLLAFSRRQAIAPRPLDLNDTALGMAKLLRRVIGEDIELAVMPGPEPAVARADPGQIEQLVMNLAVNARDAMPKGGKLTISTGVVSLDAASASAYDELPPGDYVSISVADTGVGIGDAVRPHLFEPFFTTKELGKGTGLGLATCYGIAKQNGGTIAFRSELGRGTTFQILLPRIDACLLASEKYPLQETAPRGSETVLIAEDEASVRRLGTRILSQQGYRVLEAEDGVQALEKLRADDARSIRLALVDMVMPKLGGLQLAEAIAGLRPDVRILFTSGYTDDVLPGRGAFEFEAELLRKPFSPKDLCRTVRAALDAPR